MPSDQPMTSPLLDIARAAVELAKKATQGEWRWDIDCGPAYLHVGIHTRDIEVILWADNAQLPEGTLCEQNHEEWWAEYLGSCGTPGDSEGDSVRRAPYNAALIAHAGTHHGSLGAALIEAQEEIGRLKAIVAESCRKHTYCEDSWYSCPKAEGGCSNDSVGSDCDCGADKWNARIDSALRSTDQSTPKPEGTR
jgi:hypothetical protein